MSRNGTAEQEPLTPFASLLEKCVPLAGLLDAFGSDDHAKSMTEAGQRPHDGGTFIFRRHVPNEASVDLDRIEFEITQVI